MLAGGRDGCGGGVGGWMDRGWASGWVEKRLIPEGRQCINLRTQILTPRTLALRIRESLHSCCGLVALSLHHFAQQSGSEAAQRHAHTGAVRAPSLLHRSTMGSAQRVH